MNLRQLNKKHLLEREYSTGFAKGMSSSLVDFRNGIMYINVFIDEKWKKSHAKTAYQVAHQWRNYFPELSMSLGCKVFIVDRQSQSDVKTNIKMDLSGSYSAKKGILFAKNQLN